MEPQENKLGNGDADLIEDKTNGTDSTILTKDKLDGKDEADVIGFNFGRSKTKGPLGVSPVERDALYYKMDHKHRGLAIIFNHEHFESPHLKSRAGTRADFENLYASLDRLGFFIQAYHDPAYKEISQVLDEAAAYNYSDADCFVISVLSHGESGILHAKDTAYKPDNLWSRFTADKCITLAGKPKLFFIQACQGDGLDGGVTLRTQVDGAPDMYSIPVNADFLIAFSTIPGYYSWRNTQKGSWFMQALCQELNNLSYKVDLYTILTIVNRKVAFDFESNVPDNYDMHAKKQIPCFTSMLTRLVQFEPPTGKKIFPSS